MAGSGNPKILEETYRGGSSKEGLDTMNVTMLTVHPRDDQTFYERDDHQTERSRVPIHQVKPVHAALAYGRNGDNTINHRRR